MKLLSLFGPLTYIVNSFALPICYLLVHLSCKILLRMGATFFVYSRIENVVFYMSDYVMVV